MFTVAILGATGAVGQEFLRVLEQRHFPVGELRLLASERSAGRKMLFRGRMVPVTPVSAEVFRGVQIGLFSAGGPVSEQWAPIAAQAGAIVIDNTSAFRMREDVPLVVPEVNPHTLAERPPAGIIANPNCSTIPLTQLLMPLHREFGLRRVVVSTYQSTSGAGAAAMEELRAQAEAHLLHEEPVEPSKFLHPIAFNLIPQIDRFTDSGYTREELKMVNESRKIMELPGLLLTATCVRVPVFRCHCESVNAAFAKPADPARVREIWSRTENIVVVDAPERSEYPMPLYAEGRDETFVGRLRRDISTPDGTAIDFWLASDNIRKGAALNAVQIAERLIANKVV
jgi:aspartate-semialdehyde dehydrogenase